MSCVKTLFWRLAIVYGSLADAYWSNPPKLAHNYTAEFNATVLKVPEAQRAWPLYCEAITELGTDLGDGLRESSDFEAIYGSAEATADLRRREPALAKVRRASKLPAMGFLMADQPTRADRRMAKRYFSRDQRESLEAQPLTPPSENPPLMAVLVYPVGESNQLVHGLLADALIAAEEGDSERMTDDLSAVIGYANHLREIPFAINDLAAASRYANGLYVWGLLLEEHPELFSAERLERLAGAARDFAGGDIRLRLEGERWSFYDVVQRCYTDDGNGDGFFYPTELNFGLGEGGSPDWWLKFNAPLAGPKFLTRRELIGRYDRLCDLVEADGRLPFWKREEYQSPAESARLERDRQNRLISLFAVNLTGMHAPMEAAVQHRDVLSAVAAAHRFRLDHRTWPARLEDLVPKYLAAVPLDRLTGRPVRYQVTETGPRLYSLGFDDKDDGGRAARVPIERSRESRGGEAVAHDWHWTFLGQQDKEPLDGDLILWPVRGKD
jgi:hypothetical protein